MVRDAVPFLLAALTAGIATAASAQTTVTILSPNVAPPMQLQILDTDYPFQSLLTAEEGRTSLNLILDDDGRVRTPQIIGSSGSAVLDGRAAQIARRWMFRPAEQQGTNEVKVEIAWKLPIASADEYALPLPKPPEGSVFVGPQATNSHAVTRTDYPTLSIQNNEQGEIALTFRIGADGKTDDVQVVESSGFNRLDQSAVRMVQRWTYSPGTVDGRISEFWTQARIVFFLLRARPPADYIPPFRCHARPIFSLHDRNVRAKDSTLPIASWWLSLNDSALITEALLF